MKILKIWEFKECYKKIRFKLELKLIILKLIFLILINWCFFFKIFCFFAIYIKKRFDSGEDSDKWFFVAYGG
jgi:hypothetical protein